MNEDVRLLLTTVRGELDEIHEALNERYARDRELRAAVLKLTARVLVLEGLEEERRTAVDRLWQDEPLEGGSGG